MVPVDAQTQNSQLRGGESGVITPEEREDPTSGKVIIVPSRATTLIFIRW